MQEVFENIIEKLEEEKSGLTDWAEDIAFGLGIRRSIEIVKKEAEKIGTDINVGSNGWIPCNERLPEDGVPVLIQDFEGYYSLGVSETNRKIKGFRDGDWWASANNYLAWMPLPAPYQPKGE